MPHRLDDRSDLPTKGERCSVRGCDEYATMFKLTVVKSDRAGAELNFAVGYCVPHYGIACRFAAVRG